VAGFAILALALVWLHGRVAGLEARVEHLEKVTSWLGATNGRIEERCLRRDAVVDAWLEALRLQQQDHLDRVVAWLGRALAPRGD
jgi:hypothetical protein